MINFKQEQLIEEVVNHVKGKFPEVRFVGVTESPEDPESLWIRVTAPEDDDRRSELMDYAGDKTMDILLDYGYHMLVMPTRDLSVL
ncbi:MAG: hypothetical protein GY749_42555 [Desulfobacteraceae bacterium]|nr:hypothetical protein [Desulfobacteraceae bacterium]MCP4349731.1 hypothetical protein [Desulfobacterales bacterium]